MGFKLSEFDFSYSSEYVSFKDFEEFYVSVVMSGVAYRDFLNTMGVTTGGVDITLAVVSDNVTTDGEPTNKWKVTFERAQKGISATVLGDDWYDLWVLRDTGTGEVVVATDDEDKVEELYASYLKKNKIKGVDVSGVWDNADPRFVISCEEADEYYEAKIRVDSELSSVMG